MNTLELDIIKVEQPIGTIYLSKISYDVLQQMSKVDRRHIENDDEVLGVQRELKSDKVKQIEKYLSTAKATFPNSVILNTKSKYVKHRDEHTLVLEVTDATFTIIDGQHRLAGFSSYNGAKFELIVSIFIDLDRSEQAEVFSTINSQQTKVDPSLNVNLELESRYMTPRKMILEVARSFNYDKDSPWYNSIRLLGLKDSGFISLASFARPLFGITYPEHDWFKIKNALESSKGDFASFDDFEKYPVKRYLFWHFYIKQDSASIYKILDNYFKSISNILSDDWLNEDSILCKTTGYNALIRLFRDLLPIGVERKDLSFNYFSNILLPLKKLSGSIKAENYGSSGVYSTTQLYKDFVSLISEIK